ncbi:MAG: MurR/RpiR family transcriptional regulator [Oscillospiraceae bacterium]|nr:MurR/RpiR family transcriptional regulator [Oscillospiraceae bacterium]
MSSNLLSVINKTMPSFSKGQKMIANYILTHYDKAAFMTAARLGQTVGVSESTVVRFATEIGCEGYPGLQKALQEMIRNRLTAVQRMEVTNNLLGDADVLQKVIQTDLEAVKNTLESVDRAAFESSVKAIIAAKRIYMIGVRSASALAHFLNFYFSHIFDNVHNVETSSTGAIYEQLVRAGPGDVFIGITFSRYSSRTYRAATFAKKNGATVIAITDSKDAPICRVADYILVAKSDMASFVDSLVAPLSLTNALIVAIGIEKREEISAIYTRLEAIWDENDVYQKAEPDG